LHSLQRDWNAKAQVWDSFTKSYNAIDATGAEDKYALLVNYCWSHAQSTILLCPYRVGVSCINHANIKPNVKIQWASHGQLSHDDQSFIANYFEWVDGFLLSHNTLAKSQASSRMRFSSM
jgi:hypothetical protein